MSATPTLPGIPSADDLAPLWETLDKHYTATRSMRIETLFDRDPERFERFSHSFDGLLLDISKTKLTDASMTALFALARATKVEERRHAMLTGAPVNETERRAVLHTALRAPSTASLILDGEDIIPGISETLEKMRAFSTGIRDGSIAAADGAPFTDVINIGIGGSDLGPAMATTALHPYHDGPRLHFVSNIDAAHLTDVIDQLDPKRTLVIVASKTFTTLETITNADTAFAWMQAEVGTDKAGQHFAALSTALDKVGRYQIAPDRVFGFWDWVGGRYSIWSAIGLSMMIAVGPENFDAFRAGGHAMDAHFQTAPLEHNLPVLLGLVGLWHNDICGYPTRAVIPYDQRLKRFPSYLQQLDMESNGKGVTLSGEKVTRRTGPVVWGESGTNGQHAFFQLLHQGPDIIPCEFLVAARGHEPSMDHHHQLVLANCLAQSKALMRGRSVDLARQRMLDAGVHPVEAARLAPHRACPGDRPSTTLLYEKLTPHVLGSLVALYEHRVFVEGCIWGINSFDQWGVELGKELASQLASAIAPNATIESHNAVGRDGSTRGLLAAIHNLRETNST